MVSIRYDQVSDILCHISLILRPPTKITKAPLCGWLYLIEETTLGLCRRLNQTTIIYGQGYPRLMEINLVKPNV